MKKILFVVLFSTFLSVWVTAQDRWQYGVSIGYNYARVSGNALSAKSGYNLTALGEYNVSASWSVRAKIVYDKKGFGNAFLILPIEKEDIGNNGGLNLNYVTVPLTANFHFGRSRNWYVNAGPYVGFLLNAATKDYTFTDDFRKNDFGVAYAVGVKLPVEDNIKFIVECDAQNGWQNIFKSSSYNGKNFRASINWGVVVTLR